MRTDEQRAKHAAYMRDYYAKNTARFLANSRAWRLRNVEKVNASVASYYKRNKAKVDASRRKWREEHREEIRVKHQQYYQAHKEKHRANCRAWENRNRAKKNAAARQWRRLNVVAARARNRDWKHRNPGLVKEQKMRRRAKLFGCEIDKSARAFYKFVRSKKSIACYYCGRRIPGKSAHIDHIVAVANLGNHTSSNLCASCSDCNYSKSAKPLTAWVPPDNQTVLNI